tara:strand:- start:12037 stop:12699 length:663 start_codon:yes stop_codon:yes gene_type:complete
MNRCRPHIIIEAGVEHVLGELKQRHVLYDFEKIVTYLDVKGKLVFGDQFQIRDDDREILFKLCNYYIREEENCKKLNIDLNKGILLSGPVGCGKTSLMKLLRHIVPNQKYYEVIPSRNIVFAFNHIGYKIIEDYGDKSFYCFDDLGVEPMGSHFGQECHVLGEILLSRYDLLLKHKIKTHATTNLNAKELEERYGSRVRSRMRELFNLIAFDKNSKDKRV